MSGTDIVVETEHWALRGLADKINIAVDEAENCAKSAVQHALVAGKLLIQAKGYTPHGQWETWLQASCRVAPRTAQAYMRLHTQMQVLPAPEAQRVADLPLREAIKAISTPATAPKRVTDAWLRTRRDTGQRFAYAMRKCATGMRRVANDVEGNYAKRRQIEAAKKKLQAAIDQLDAYLAEAEVLE
jgi:hypothetical protein